MQVSMFRLPLYTVHVFTIRMFEKDIYHECILPSIPLFCILLCVHGCVSVHTGVLEYMCVDD